VIENKGEISGNVVAGVDVGGTFTDLILIDGRGAGQVAVAKTPTTPDNQAGGVVDALEKSGFPVEDIDLIVHGTTTTTNAVLERRLARTGLITTRGFRDVIELGRRTRPQPYGMTGRFVPVIPRELRLEVAERMEASGRVREALDEDGLRAAVKALLAAGCESLVIHFLHAYANPDHERRAGALLAAAMPELAITLSSSIPLLQALVPDWLRTVFIPNDKTYLAPYRVIHLAALVLLVVHFVPKDWPGLGWPGFRPLIKCGQQSLEVFCIGVFLSFVAHFVLITVSDGILAQLTVGGCGLSTMIAVAYYRSWSKRIDKLAFANAEQAGQTGSRSW
jgi:hypothetical protein